MWMNDIFIDSGRAAPCENCTDRALGCHGKCERYAEWKEKYTATGEAIKSKKLKTAQIEDFVNCSINKARVSLGRKRR